MEIPSHSFITEHQSLRMYQTMDTITEIDPEYYL